MAHWSKKRCNNSNQNTNIRQKHFRNGFSWLLLTGALEADFNLVLCNNVGWKLSLETHKLNGNLLFLQSKISNSQSFLTRKILFSFHRWQRSNICVTYLSRFNVRRTVQTEENALNNCYSLVGQSTMHGLFCLIGPPCRAMRRKWSFCCGVYTVIPAFDDLVNCE